MSDPDFSGPISILIKPLLDLTELLSRMGVNNPTLRFSEKDGLLLERIALSDDMFFYAKSCPVTLTEAGFRRFALAGVTFEWDDRKAQIAAYQKAMDEAMSAFAR